MGSVLGPIVNNFYISDVGNKVRKPSIYLRYVDDILIVTNDINDISIL